MMGLRIKRLIDETGGGQTEESFVGRLAHGMHGVCEIDGSETLAIEHIPKTYGGVRGRCDELHGGWGQNGGDGCLMGIGNGRACGCGAVEIIDVD